MWSLMINQIFGGGNVEQEFGTAEGIEGFVLHFQGDLDIVEPDQARSEELYGTLRFKGHVHYEI